MSTISSVLNSIIDEGSCVSVNWELETIHSKQKRKTSLFREVEPFYILFRETDRSEIMLIVARSSKAPVSFSAPWGVFCWRKSSMLSAVIYSLWDNGTAILSSSFDQIKTFRCTFGFSVVFHAFLARRFSSCDTFIYHNHLGWKIWVYFSCRVRFRLHNRLICGRDGLLCNTVNLTEESYTGRDGDSSTLQKCKAHLRGSEEAIHHVDAEQRIQYLKCSSLFVYLPCSFFRLEVTFCPFNGNKRLFIFIVSVASLLLLLTLKVMDLNEPHMNDTEIT